MNGEVTRPVFEEEVREEWGESCGDLHHNPVEEEIGFDVLELIGEREEVKQLSITSGVSVDR